MTKVIVDLEECVDRFLAWRLPDKFTPDGGVSFKPTEYAPAVWPSGTNLLDATQTREMVLHVFGLK